MTVIRGQMHWIRARTWYRAHNASIVAAYLEHWDVWDALRPTRTVRTLRSIFPVR